jgi:hypothetical protein
VALVCYLSRFIDAAVLITSLPAAGTGKLFTAQRRTPSSRTLIGHIQYLGQKGSLTFWLARTAAFASTLKSLLLNFKNGQVSQSLASRP